MRKIVTYGIVDTYGYKAKEDVLIYHLSDPRQLCARYQMVRCYDGVPDNGCRADEIMMGPISDFKYIMDMTRILNHQWFVMHEKDI